MANNNKHTGPNVPALRFPEFSGEWIESKLGDIADFSKGAGISKDQRSEEGNPCILYGELYTRYKSEVITNVFSKTALPDSELVKSKANDIIIPASGETAEDIATARCVPFDNILLGGDLNIIRLHEQDGKFFSYQLNGVRKYDIATVAQGVSVVHLHAGDLKGITVKYPSHIAEQEKISQILGLIDDRIATQSKIIEDKETLYKAIIDKHFKEIRKNDAIQEVYLSNVFKERVEYSSNDGVFPHASLTKEGVSIKTDRYNRDFLVKDTDKQYKVTRINDICYNPANLKFGVITRNKVGTLIFSPIYVTFEVRNGYDPAYIELMVTNSDFINKILRFQEGTVYERMAVSSEDFLSESCKIPDLEIQTEFSAHVSKIEQSIQVEKKYLESIRRIKNYILEAMFI